LSTLDVDSVIRGILQKIDSSIGLLYLAEDIRRKINGEN